MNDWQIEYEKRLRRVAGVTDDSREVYVETDFEEGYQGCETCNYGGQDGRTVITVIVNGESYFERKTAGFSDMGELLREMGEVEL